MSAFTKGPWRLEKPNKKSRDYVVWNKVGNIVINTGSCNDSNARLIAEAPAMAELLASFVHEFGDKANNSTVGKARALLARLEADK